MSCLLAPSLSREKRHWRNEGWWSSVTWWLDIFSIFGHLLQWKFAQLHGNFPNSITICPIAYQFAKVVQKFCQGLLKFRQIWSHWTDEVWKNLRHWFFHTLASGSHKQTREKNFNAIKFQNYSDFKRRTPKLSLRFTWELWNGAIF